MEELGGQTTDERWDRSITVTPLRGEERTLGKALRRALRRTKEARSHQSIDRSRDHGNSPRPSPIIENISGASHSPATAPTNNQKRISISSRLSDPRTGICSGEERIPAKERLSVNTQRTSRSGTERQVTETEDLPHLAAPNLEVVVQPRFCDSITRPSSSNIFDTGGLGPGKRSPIRTLSEDRVHVFLRLGPLLSDTTEDTEESSVLPNHPALSAKAPGKRIARRCNLRSPSQGVAMKKRRITKTHSSPRRKLMLDAITAREGQHDHKDHPAGA
ncbi:hypothetical protein DY000_02011696 [Brassica cretica]|uniref:Uncharacterized protein n=1 Tax=Brassica cretica TaxID=69181 RepID=A0ABQ7DA47_BRACR|nr:hypothetical protein DY000_02011696 [Brassica cretica]